MIDDFNQSISGSSGSNAFDDKRFPATTTLPAWYQQLETQLDAAIVPNFQTIQEAAMLAGWTDQVMASAGRLYARNYRNQRVSNPAALFSKLASQEASKVAVPAKLVPAQLLRRPPQAKVRGKTRRTMCHLTTALLTFAFVTDVQAHSMSFQVQESTNGLESE